MQESASSRKRPQFEKIRLTNSDENEMLIRERVKTAANYVLSEAYQNDNVFGNKLSYKVITSEVVPGTTVMFPVDKEDENEMLDAEWATTQK